VPLAHSALKYAGNEEQLVHFHGEKVVRANIQTQLQLQELNKLDLDVWSHDSLLSVGTVDMRVNASDIEVMRSLGVDLEVFIGDLEALLSQEREDLINRTNELGASWYDAYHTYAEIVQHLQDIANSFPQLARYVATIGKSVQGMDIPALIVTATTSPSRRVFFGGGQHAREWIGPATAMYVTEQLIVKYSTDADVKRILDNFLFVLVPVINTDGYSYTWTTNRLWRKNRRANAGGSFGVDLNRNWDDHWCEIGGSTTPSSDTYCGTGPFSEPETRSASSFVLQYVPFNGAIDYHSYSQLILRPYGWTQTPPPNDAIPKAAGDGYAAAVRAVEGKIYTSQYAWQLYYTSGTSRDWFGSKGNIPRGYTIELRDTGQFGFQLPANQIIPTGEENFAAVKWFANHILSSN